MPPHPSQGLKRPEIVTNPKGKVPEYYKFKNSKNAEKDLSRKAMY